MEVSFQDPINFSKPFCKILLPSPKSLKAPQRDSEVFQAILPTLRPSNMPSIHYAGKLTLGDLPLELVREISTYLPAYSVAALSLTCKDLYNDETLRQSWTQKFYQAEKEKGYSCFFGTKLWLPHFRNIDLLLLLRLLERDLPYMSVCGNCERLHTIRKIPLHMSRNDCECWSPYSKAPDLGMWLHWEDWDFNLSFEHVQDFMRHHILGPGFGSSTKRCSLVRNWHSHRFSTKYHAVWMRRLELRPTIINDCLMITTSQHIMVSDQYLQSLTNNGEDCIHIVANLASCSFKICQCYRSGKTVFLKREIKRQLRQLWQDASKADLSTSLVLQLSRCSTCLTEFDFSLLRHKKGLYELVLNTWTNLGSCSSTYDPSWVLAISYSEYHYSSETIEELRRLAVLHIKYPSEHLQLEAIVTAIEDPFLRSFLEQHAAESQLSNVSGSDNRIAERHATHSRPIDLSIVVNRNSSTQRAQHDRRYEQSHLHVSTSLPPIELASLDKEDI